MAPQATAVLSGDSVASIVVSNGGSGYGADHVPIVYVEPPASGTQAKATAVLTGGSISSIVVAAGGSGYTGVPAVRIIDGYTDSTNSAIVSTVANVHASELHGGVVKAARLEMSGPVIFSATDTFDSAPTSGSSKLLTSGSVFTAVDSVRPLRTIALAPEVAVYADGVSPSPVPSSLRSTYNESGWYFRNTGGSGKINWYVNPDTTMKVRDIQSMALCLYLVSKTSPPYISIYTKPQASGNGASWYHARVNYVISDLSVLSANTKYTFGLPLTKTPTAVYGSTYTELTRDNSFSVGTLSPTDDILFFAIGTNSASTTGSVEFVATSLVVQQTSGATDFRLSEISNTYTETLIGAKADQSYVSSQIGSVNNSISSLNTTKADTSYVNTQVSNIQSSISSTSTSLSTKADKTYVDLQDGLLQAQITSQGGSVSALQTQVGSIQTAQTTDEANISSLQSDKADKTYVDSSFQPLITGESDVTTGTLGAQFVVTESFTDHGDAHFQGNFVIEGALGKAFEVVKDTKTISWQSLECKTGVAIDGLLTLDAQNFDTAPTSGSSLLVKSGAVADAITSAIDALHAGDTSAFATKTYVDSTFPKVDPAFLISDQENQWAIDQVHVKADFHTSAQCHLDQDVFCPATQWVQELHVGGFGNPDDKYDFNRGVNPLSVDDNVTTGPSAELRVRGLLRLDAQNFDTIPTTGSDKLLTSDGIYTAITNAVAGLPMDVDSMFQPLITDSTDIACKSVSTQGVQIWGKDVLVTSTESFTVTNVSSSSWTTTLSLPFAYSCDAGVPVTAVACNGDYSSNSGFFPLSAVPLYSGATATNKFNQVLIYCAGTNTSDAKVTIRFSYKAVFSLPPLGISRSPLYVA